MLNVLLDGKALTDASSFRGIGGYVRSLVDGLSRSEEVSLSVLATADAEVPEGVRRIAVRPLAPARYRRAEHDLRLPGYLRRADADVFHSPALDPPRRSPRPWVQTLHDLIPLVFPDRDFDGDRRRLRRQAPLFRDAAAIIAVSRHTADEGIRVLGLNPARVHVIHHGVDPAFRPPAVRPVASEPYVLCVSEFGPHKGYAEAFELIASLAEHGLPHRLRMVGRVVPWTRDKILALQSASPRPDRVDLAGYVDDLPALYQGADAAVVTSRYEGFGLPALEAMACGTPVVAFANSATTEIVGDGGVLVPDGDVGAMADAVASLVSDEGRWYEASQQGLERAGAFSWPRSVAAHLEVYGSVAASSKGRA